jgi:hypothetical protein
MGGDEYEVHDSYNQVKRGQLGWIPRGTLATIEDTGPNGEEYQLYPIQSTGMHLKTLRIPRVNGPTFVDQYYYVEFRQPTIWDTFPESHPVNNGVLIRLAHDFPGGERSYLIDSTPEGSPAGTSFLNAPFVPQPGQPAIFEDLSTNTKIEVCHITKGPTIEDSYATVKVTANQELDCTWDVPDVLLTSPGDSTPILAVRVQNGSTKTGSPASFVGAKRG